MTAKAALQGPIAGAPVIMLGQYNLAALGYLLEEYFLTGTATSYELAGTRGDDGRWEARTAATAPFTTRVVVCRPDSAARFNGTVVLEWLNVSGGLDAPPDWYMFHRQMLREGMAWVGVSAQIVGIEGGGPLGGAGIPLKRTNPQRYNSLAHPGDAFAYDIFTQAGRAVLEPAGSGILGPLTGRRTIAAGASQSAIFLVTYVNAVDPLAKVFDGFLVHGRGGSGAGIDGEFIPSSRRSVNVSGDAPLFTGTERIRDDVRVPVLTIQSETDVLKLGGIGARQPDAERFRLWEIAGAAHFDSYGLIASQFDDGSLAPGRFAELNRPISELMGMQTDLPINSGPQFHYVSQAAIAALWNDGFAKARPPRRRGAWNCLPATRGILPSTRMATSGAASAHHGWTHPPRYSPGLDKAAAGSPSCSAPPARSTLRSSPCSTRAAVASICRSSRRPPTRRFVPAFSSRPTPLKSMHSPPLPVRCPSRVRKKGFLRTWTDVAVPHPA